MTRSRVFSLIGSCAMVCLTLWAIFELPDPDVRARCGPSPGERLATEMKHLVPQRIFFGGQIVGSTYQSCKIVEGGFACLLFIPQPEAN